MVYVINIDGVPVMPTERHGKVRRWLRDKKAKVVKRTPFTIQLLFKTTDITQPLTLGVDAGSKNVGLSVTSDKKEYYSSEVELRTDIADLLSTRREQRRTRRNRKTRYRKARFNNRTHSKKKGWLAPSVEEREVTHERVVDDVVKILPITKIAVETASFDTQLLKAKDLGLPLPKGTDYQRGEQLYFWNVREYVFFRDNHTCQCCKGKSKDNILNVHHIQSRKTGGDSPANLITLCETCHKGYHNGTVTLPENIKRGASYRDAAFMGTVRWKLFNRLKLKYPNVHNTYGYLTKNSRIENNLPKEHRVDARCISGNPLAVPSEEVFFQKKVRCHNRQIHKSNILKGGMRKLNQAPKYVKGYQLFDKVRLPDGRTGFIFGRRSSGYFDIRTLDGTKLSAGISYKQLKPLEKRRTILTERRRSSSPLTIEITSVRTADS